MKTVSILYHSGYGHTTNQAKGIVSGIDSVEQVQAKLIAINQDGEITESDWQTLDASDAIIFGSPTYMGMASWQFKKVADATSQRWLNQAWKNKVAAGFTNSASMNGDKHSTLHYFMTLAMQHSMLWVGTGLMPSNTKAAKRDDLNYLGSFSGLLAQSPSDASTDEAPTTGDIETAKAFGVRVATVVRDLLS
ncbi:flavodoxin family protein [Rhabdochromatium marinum]|uniref:flavodoxin family protein n=1 Tax=Rhabdochromatium marinum TaxID=48729 RepID=UPI001905B8DB|nr:flavodoxin family protein [Rhabdochromatium marinum]MBK1650233.1 NADPH-dependent FMN reductase [Rhabdochromatium marinum]